MADPVTNTTTPTNTTELDRAIKAMNDANMQMFNRNVQIDQETAASKAAKNKS